jgi:hypothetical protein
MQHSPVQKLFSKKFSSKQFNSSTFFLKKQKLNIIQLILRFKTLQAMRLKAPISCMHLSREDSHLLVGLRDGKLIVITGDRQMK